MKFIPLLFKTSMVEAIMNRTKTQTRRIIKFPIDWDGVNVYKNPPFGIKYSSTEFDGCVKRLNSNCQIGDVIWIREAFQKVASFPEPDSFGKYLYKAMGDYCATWKPGIHMPKEACRLFLDVTNVRAERLQDITEEDAKAEGVLNMYAHDPSIGSVAYLDYMDKKGGWDCVADDAKHSFQTLWQSIHGVESWEANPWVWVNEFNKIDKPADFK